MRILITGASGYLGRACTRAFLDAGWVVRAVSRTGGFIPGVEYILAGDFARHTDWSVALGDVDVVLHLAGIAHRPQTDEQIYRTVNVDGTTQLVRSAALAGVSRFLFVSSIAVYGRRQKSGVCFDEFTPLSPEGAYGRSKVDAEKVVSNETVSLNMAWTIVRPPLVYGPSAPGNFGRLVALVMRGVPLPLLGARAPRSYIGLDNLVSALLCAATHPAAANRTFVVSDDEDISTAELVRLIADGMGKPARLWWLPEPLLRFGAAAVGRLGDVERLFETLRVDCRQIKDALGWRPPVSVREGVRRAMLVK